jgi:hypothetical protein
MNRIVREHYPVANLPEDLRDQLAGAETVRVVIEPDMQAGQEKPADIRTGPLERSEPLGPDQFREGLRRLRNSGLPNVTPQEAAREIRELRDEWESE